MDEFATQIRRRYSTPPPFYQPSQTSPTTERKYYVRLAPSHRLFRIRPRTYQDGFHVRMDISIVIDVKDNDDIAHRCNTGGNVLRLAKYQEKLVRKGLGGWE